MIKEDLKIELRAVKFSKNSGLHVLEYRISPDQDLKYHKEHRWFWGLVKFKTISKYSTSWKRPVTFFNGTISKYYSENDTINNNYPIFMYKKDDFENWKSLYKTYGELMNAINEIDNKYRLEYRIAREKFLESIRTWY